MQFENVYPKSGVSSPTNRGPTELFWTISQLKGNFNSLYLRNETTMCTIGKCVGNYNGISYIVSISKCQELWSTNGLKLDRSLYPSSVNSAKIVDQLLEFIRQKFGCPRCRSSIVFRSRKSYKMVFPQPKWLITSVCRSPTDASLSLCVLECR